MNPQPRAFVRILQLPQITPDVVRVEIECRYGATGLTSLPGPSSLPVPALIIAACFEHEAQCGKCDMSEAHAEGSRALREETERIWAAHCQARVRGYTQEVRN